MQEGKQQTKEGHEMSRTSSDQVIEGRLINGYDYNNQAWVVDGKYVRCGHPESMDCSCFGKIAAGQETVTNGHSLNGMAI